jgi:hypothetical protein
MHQLEAILHLAGLEHFRRLHHLAGRKPELGVFAAGGRPFAGAFRQEPDAHPDDGRTPICCETSMIALSSSTFSTTMMIVLPSLRPSSAIWM